MLPAEEPWLLLGIPSAVFARRSALRCSIAVQKFPHRHLFLVGDGDVSRLRVALSGRCRACDGCAARPAARDAANCMHTTFRVELESAAGGSAPSSSGEAHASKNLTSSFRCVERFRQSAQDATACSRKGKGSARRFAEVRRRLQSG